MSASDLVVFDTCTLPEYYNDVHTVLALPAGHVLTYDYGAYNVSLEAQAVLRRVKDGERPRAVLAYIQPIGYVKGAGTNVKTVLHEPTMQTLTRLAEVVAVREVSNGEKVRFYFDLELGGYPYDANATIAGQMVEQLRAAGEMPMKTYVAVFPSTKSEALFAQEADDPAFSNIVSMLSRPDSQFRRDTFWRIKGISHRTRSLLPLVLTKVKPLEPRTVVEGGRSVSVLELVDQSTIYFHVQFQRGEEHGSDYRLRRVTVEGSPKAASDLIRSSFSARSFGQEAVAISIPATSSLSAQTVRVQFATQLHEKDDVKDYPYGPQPAIEVRYRKALLRSLLAILSVVAASVLFAWAAFATSFATAPATDGIIVPLAWRGAFAAVGVLLSLYAYYLWTDDVALDKARRT